MPLLGYYPRLPPVPDSASWLHCVLSPHMAQLPTLLRGPLRGVGHQSTVAGSEPRTPRSVRDRTSVCHQCAPAPS